MKTRLFGINISFSFWFFALITVFLTVGRQQLALYFILPVVIHECGHIIAMFFCGIGIEAVSFNAFGIDIQRKLSTTSSYAKDIIVSLGGIAANLVTAVLVYTFAFASVRTMFFISVNIAVALFNAMPVGNLDGGQILEYILAHRSGPERARKISGIFSLLLLIPLFALAILLILRDFANISLLIVCIYLAFVVIFGD